MEQMKNMLDYVDKNDNLLGTLPREEVYEKGLIIRISRVFVFNNEGKLLFQLRSKNKSHGPLHWTSAVGGHVEAGESYVEAALREFEEELGTTSHIEFMFKEFFIVNEKPRFLSVFRSKHNGPFDFNKHEIENVEFFSIEEIQKMIDSGEKFLSEDLFLLEKHFGIQLK